MMATKRCLAAGRSTWQVPVERSDAADAIDAISRLAGARSAEVLVFDHAAERLSSATASSSGRLDLDTPALTEAAQALTGSILRDAPPRWISDQDAATLFLMKVSEYGQQTFFIALVFAEASAVIRARVARLAPDLTMLVRHHIGVAVRLRELEDLGTAATTALDHSECGVIAIRSDRSIVFRNEAASAYMEDAAGLQVRRGRLAATTDPNRFEAAVDRISAAPAGIAKRLTASVMLLKRADGKRPTVIVVAPIRPVAPAATPVVGHRTGAAALVYVFDPARGAQRGLDVLSNLHGLSGVETRLLVAITSGMTLADAAAQMRIKLETARTYLKQIFAKTGTHRQTDLVTMMSRYLRAFRGDFDFQPM